MSTTENTQEFESRITAAASTLGVSTDDLKLKLGVSSIEMLDDDDVLKFGDLRELFKEKGPAAVRLAFKQLKGGKKSKREIEETGSGRIEELRALGLKVRLEDADPASLLKVYLPDKPSDPVTNALRKRFGEKPIIAFRDDGTVALTETCQYLADLEQHFPERKEIMVDGKLTQLWPVGCKPYNVVDEDPLFPGQPLRNGYSLVNHRNWTNISLRNRQLCRIILERGDIDPDNREAVLRLLERAQEAELAEAYQEAELEFRNREIRDTLPKLKVELGLLTNKPNNPFGVRRQY